LPDALWLRIAPLILPSSAETEGRAPPVCLTGWRSTVILFVLKTGIAWEYLPAEMGCGSRDDVLAEAAGLLLN
jgi:transposase